MESLVVFIDEGEVVEETGTFGAQRMKAKRLID